MGFPIEKNGEDKEYQTYIVGFEIKEQDNEKDIENHIMEFIKTTYFDVLHLDEVNENL